MLHTSLIAGHAVSALAAFGLGALIAVRGGGHPAHSWLYAIALTLMTVFVASVVAVDWGTLAGALRGVFAALLALATYTTWRGWRARSRLRAGPASRTAALDDIGFTLITLFTGFVVILAQDLGGPVWLVVLAGIVAVVAGRRLVRAVTSRPAGAQPR